MCIGEKHLFQNVIKYNSILCYIQILSSNLIQIEGIPNLILNWASSYQDHVNHDTIIHQVTVFLKIFISVQNYAFYIFTFYSPGNKKRKKSRDGDKPLEDNPEHSQVKT